MKFKTTCFIAPIYFILLCSQLAYSQEYQEKKNAIQSIWNEFALKWEAFDAKGCAEFYLPDGLNIPPSLPENRGREAIGNFYQMLFDNHLSASYSHEVLEAMAIDEGIIERGKFTVKWVRKDQSEWTFHARSLTHWVKDEAGKWKVRTLLFNEDVTD